MAAIKDENKQDDKKQDDKGKADNKNKSTVKLVVYDFDQTITASHLYYELSQSAISDDSNGQTDALSQMKDKELLSIFGGQDRLEAVDKHFKKLKDNDIELAIISYGYVQVIKDALTRMNLFEKYFKDSRIIGNDSIELQENGVNGNKSECIKRQFQENNQKLKPKQIIFVDDDKYNILEAEGDKEQGKDPICQTLEISPRQGMNNDHMAVIETMAGIKKE